MTMPRSIILTKYHFASMWNWRSVYIGRLIEPVAYYAFLGAGLSHVVASGLGVSSDSYLEFVLIGMLTLIAFRAGISSISDVSNDRKWGVFAIFRMQGGSPAGYLVSLILVAEGIYLLQAVVLLAFSWLVSGQFVTGIVWSAVLIGMFVVAGWVAAGASIGAQVQSYAVRDLVVTLATLPIILSAPLFYPFDRAPKYLQIVSSFNPVKYQVEWLRSGGSISFVWAAMWCVVTAMVGVVMLKSAESVSTER